MDEFLMISLTETLAHRDGNAAAEVRSLRKINASAHLSLCKALLIGG
jgi:hypothetical protein